MSYSADPTLDENGIKQKKDELNSYKAKVIELQSIGTELVQESLEMPAKAKDILVSSPLKIPKALKNIANGTKAVKNSVEEIVILIKTIPLIIDKIKQTPTNNAVASSNTAQNTQISVNNSENVFVSSNSSNVTVVEKDSLNIKQNVVVQYQSVRILEQKDILLLQPTPGQMIYNSTSNILLFYNGKNWQEIKTICCPYPSKANAGVDIISYDTTFSTTLNANLPELGIGKWKLLSGINGSILDNNLYNTNFSGVPFVKYILRWSVETACDISNDEITVAFLPQIIYPDTTKYKTTLINNQFWFAENLRANKCFSGNSISKSYYYNDSLKYISYGKLYDWNSSIIDTSLITIQGICPSGWHIPSTQDFEMLLKNNTFSTLSNNNFLFSFSGLRTPEGSFSNIDNYMYLWTSDKIGSTAKAVKISKQPFSYEIIELDRHYSISIRCVKD